MKKFRKATLVSVIAVVANLCVSVANAQGDYVSYGDSVVINFSSYPFLNAGTFLPDGPATIAPLIVLDYSPSQVPEPSPILLSGFALGLIGMLRRRANPRTWSSPVVLDGGKPLDARQIVNVTPVVK